MNPKTILWLSALVGLTATGVTAAESEPKSFDIDGIEQIEAGDGVRLQIRQSDTASLRVEAGDEAREKLRVDIRGDRLILGLDDGFWGFLTGWFGGCCDGEDVTYQVALPELRTLKLTAGNQALVEPFEADELTIDLSAGSQAKLGALTLDALTLAVSAGSGLEVGRIEGHTVRVDTSSGSQLTITETGEVTQLSVTASSGSHYRGQRLSAGTIRVDSSSGANVELGASDSLRVEASSGSRVGYRGQPGLEQTVSSGAMLEALDD